MTVHKLTAGDGYTYLTRQVASADEQRAPGQSLAEYYAARGNPPGVGSVAARPRLGVKDTVVTETQMRALFGEGCHPNRDELIRAGVAERETWLGARYSTMTPLPPLPDRVQAATDAFEERTAGRRARKRHAGSRSPSRAGCVARWPATTSSSRQ